MRLGTVRWAGSALLILVVAFEVTAILTMALPDVHRADSSSYQAAAQRVLAGGSPYSAMQLAGPYALGAAAHGGGYLYPPPSILLFLPLAFMGDVWWPYALLGLGAFLAVALLIVRRELGLTLPGFLFTIAVGLALPGWTDVKLGQIGPLVAAVVGLGWLLPSWSGVAGGPLKLYPGLNLVLAIRRRERLLPALLAGAAIALLTLPWWRDFAVAWLNAKPECSGISMGSFACAGVPWLGYLTAGGLVLGAFVVRSDALAFALLGLAMVAPAPDWYIGYLEIPAIAALPLLCRGLCRYLTTSR